MEQYILFIKENMMCQDLNGMFNYRIKFKFNWKIYIKIMRCKIVRTQKLMWHNIMSSTKGQKVSVLYYSIDSNVVYSVSAPISVWSLEWNISVPINTSVPFRVYRKYIYIYNTFLLPYKIINSKQVKLNNTNNS